MKRPNREKFPMGMYGEIWYVDKLEKYCSYLEEKLNSINVDETEKDK